MVTAILPTPPAAPVTSTSPRSGVTPCSSRASTDSMAVNPAVPMAIVSRALSPSGTFTSHSLLSRAFCA